MSRRTQTILFFLALPSLLRAPRSWCTRTPRVSNFSSSPSKDASQLTRNVRLGYPHTHYFEPTLSQISPHGYPAPQYYQAHAPQPTHTSYGNVYYALGNDTGSAYESKKRGYDALNEFFGDLKRRQFDLNSYADVGQRLLGLQSVQLPMVSAPAAEYQPVPAAAAVAATGGGGGYQPAAPPAYQLPPMSSVRTKNDLVNIDRFLEQMQNTIYESDDHIAAAGVAQPGAHFVPVSYRTTNSPPTQLPAIGTTAPVVPRAASTTHSPSASATPALTPPSSAQSHTSGLSPRSSLHTGHRLSPPQQHDSSSALYPRLPATTMADNMPSYPTVNGGATTSTLSSTLEDERRRYTGGTLHRARPDVRESPTGQAMLSSSSSEGKDDSDGSPAATVRQLESPHVSVSLIDPALHADASSPDQEAVQRTAQAATAVADRADVQWVEKVRLIEYMRNYIGSRLEQGEFEDEDMQQGESLSPEGEHGGDRMEGIESGDMVEEKQPVEEVVKNDLYPVLRVMDEDGDCKVEDAV